MTTTPQKRGRKAHDFQCTWDDSKTINGLHRKGKSNVWRIRATGQEFTEPVERLAVAKFLKLTGASAFSQVITPNQPDNPDSKMTLQQVGVAPTGNEAPEEFTKGVQASLEAAKLAYETGTRSLPLNLDCPENWAFFREQLLRRPQYVAQQVGFEQLGWLGDLKRPTASPALKGLIDAYVTKTGRILPHLSENEQTRSRTFWAEFLRWSGAETLAGITHESVAKYEAKVRAEGMAAKSLSHRFSKVKSVIAYALKRGTDAKECRRALDVLGMLEMPEATGLDPHPISPKDFWAVYKAATAAGDQTFATMMLTALNCCMYSGECCDLEWAEVNLKTGEVVTRRPKTGVARVAVLWPETVKAIKALPHERDNLFFSERVGYSAQLVWKRWTRYATPLKLTAHFSDIRDGAYTTACRSVSLDKAKILAGHRLSGATDHYVQRNPQFVADACKAIGKAYNVAKLTK